MNSQVLRMLSSFLCCVLTLPANTRVRRVDGSGTFPVRAQSTNEKSTDNYLIEPGKRVGQVRLGESIERAFDVIDFEEGETIETDTCGQEYIAVDKKGRPQGNFSIRFKDSVIFQIESGTSRFHTSEGIRAYDSPDAVHSRYRELRAYAVLGNSPMAFGGGPLIYWIDWTKGMAFLFASERKNHHRYLYSIIVFKPGGEFCPEWGSTKSPEWRELKPYSLSVGSQ